MCGINGFNWTDENLAKAMNKAIKHRGPDDQGVQTSNNSTLAQVRLSIIDLSDAGHQPMNYDSKIGACSEKHLKKNIPKTALTITFNGEIYNYQELRKELKEEGYDFTTQTDTEVILASYQEWGTECVKKFNGMWAFCIHDKKKNILFLSRDRLGQKPLYYYISNNKFIFSSEIKGILQHKIKKEINLEAVDFYLTTGFIPSPISIYKHISKIEPRQNMVFDTNTKKITKNYYYNIPKYLPVQNKKKLIEKGKSILKDATRLRLIADVPVGAFLSGGLDSSVVVSTMSNFIDLNNLHTFSIGFDGKFDETKYMEIVKNSFKTKHHHKYFKERDFEKLLDNISYYYDEPFGDFSNFPTYDVSKLARKNVTVSLSGDGGDEIFGGYPMHQIAAQLNIIRKMPAVLRKIAYTILPKKDDISLIGRLKEALRLSLLKPETFYAEIGSNFVYKPSNFKKWSSNVLKELLKLSNNNFVEAIIKYDQFYNTLGDNFLVKVDRASMAHALEVRSPFLDYRFIEYSSKIPVKWKVNSFKTKILMRKIIKGKIPDKIVNRGKQGFTPPLVEWINKDKYLIQTKKGLEILHKKGLINKKWYDFYNNTVFKINNIVYNNYKIRLLLIWKWWEKWGEKIK